MVIAWRSEPALASVMQRPARRSPVAMSGRRRDRSSSLPWVLIIQETMVWVLRMPPRLIQPRETSSTMAA